MEAEIIPPAFMLARATTCPSQGFGGMFSTNNTWPFGVAGKSKLRLKVTFTTLRATTTSGSDGLETTLPIAKERMNAIFAQDLKLIFSAISNLF
jgi:hypothetical protein